ncbi:MAG: glycerophosphodiester phosphodiesterase [Proteobacteria bacterium]|nr:glycerophosphodiester phosphodiesterase [Pseudomonadota bacterium]
MAHPYFDPSPPLVLGHRGAAGDAPENTLEAFARGTADGAHILESDVQATSDGVPVLLHDPDVDRTTDGRGAAAELEWEQLQALDAGFRFDPSGDGSFPARGRGHRVPSVEEAFARLPDARFNLEIKSAAPGLIDRMLDLVEAAGRAERTLLTAGNDAIMAELRERTRARGIAVALGACTGDVLGFVKTAISGEPPPDGVMALQIPVEFAGRPLITPELLSHAHRHQVQVHAWTINDPAEIARLLELGVDGIVTDHPGRMARWLSERA